MEQKDKISRDDLKLSAVNRVDKYTRNLSKIRARIKKIENQKIYTKAIYNRAVVEKELGELKTVIRRLDNNYTIEPIDIDRKYGTTKEHITRLFGQYYKNKKLIGNENKKEKAITHRLEEMTKITRSSRITELKRRMNEELLIAKNKNAYIIFNTLTANEMNIDKVFQKNYYWKEYLRNWRKKTIDHRYFAVLEEGDKKGREHIHVIHIFTETTMELKDPNKTYGPPKKREIIEIKKLWKYGYSSPIAVRWSQNDRFGKNGHKWPVKKEGLKYIPIEPTKIMKLTNYLTKYIVKAYQKRETTKWRTKTSRQFGRTVIKETISRLSNETLRIVMRDPQIIKMATKEKERTEEITITIEAHREILKRLTNKKKKRKLLATVTPQPSLKQQLTNMIQKKTEYNYQSITPTGIKNTIKTAVSEIKNTWEIVIQEKIGTEYEVKIKGNIKGESE